MVERQFSKLVTRVRFPSPAPKMAETYTKLLEKIHKMTIFKKIAKFLAAYFLFFVPTLIACGLIWTMFIDGKLYHCSDPIPVLDILPPFIHGTQYGDYWIADPKLVWSIWFLLLGLMIIIPSILTIGFFKAKKS